MRRVHVEHMADPQPVKQHPQRREMQFHGRPGKPLPLWPRQARRFDISSDVGRFHEGKVQRSSALAPIRKPTGCLVIRPPLVLVLVIRGEEAEEPLRRFLIQKNTAGNFAASPASERGSLKGIKCIAVSYYEIDRSGATR